MKNFLTEIKKFKKHRQKSDNEINVMQIGTAPKGWLMIYCPSKKPEKEGRYYAASLASAKTIQSGESCIRQAYRIDPGTGEVECLPKMHEGEREIDEEEPLPRVFAVKQFATSELQEKAKGEARALSLHQFVDFSFDADARPIIISNFYQGHTICNDEGKPNQEFLNTLSLQDRVYLILQIANQYFAMQAHEKPHIHVDIKGPNVIVDVEREDGAVEESKKRKRRNAYLIDFGSAKALGENGRAETSLSGLTACAVPLEALGKYVEIEANKTDEVSVVLNKKTALPEEVFQRSSGELSGKSDVYAMAPVFAILLGATAPYQKRTGEGSEIRTPKGEIDLNKLLNQIWAGFGYQGALENLPAINIGLENNSVCGFKNFSVEEAPNDSFILREEKYGNAAFKGYLLFKNQLLFVDKQANQVKGRRGGGLRAFSPLYEKLRTQESIHALSADFLSQCTAYTPGYVADQADQRNIADIVRDNVRCFLERMSELFEENRPGMDEVLQYFTSLGKIVSLSSSFAENNEDGWEGKARNTQILKQIEINYLKLNCILYNAWNIKIGKDELEGESEVEECRLRDFDFDCLEEETDQSTKLMEQFLAIFDHEVVLNSLRALGEKDFQFLSIKSEAKKMHESILKRLEKLALSETDTERLNDELKALLLKWKRDDKLKGSFSLLAGEFLSFPPQLIKVLLDKSELGDGFLNLELMQAYLKHRSMLEKHFGDSVFIRRIKEAISSDENFLNRLIQMDSLIVDKNGSGRDIIELLICLDGMTSENQISKWGQLEKKLSHLLTNKSGEGEIEIVQIIDFLKDVEKFKEKIIKISSESTYLDLRKMIVKPLLGNIRAYVDEMKKWDRDSYRVSFFNFGGFGFKVGEKLDAANALLEAFETGDYESLLTNSSHLAALKQKTLGKISHDLLATIEHLHQEKTKSQSPLNR